jgi:hypothetical protein
MRTKGMSSAFTPAMLAIRVQTADGGAASSEVSTTAVRASGSLISDKSMERLDALGM